MKFADLKSLYKNGFIATSVAKNQWILSHEHETHAFESKRGNGTPRTFNTLDALVNLMHTAGVTSDFKLAVIYIGNPDE